MSITINGSTGISGVDGSSTTPAFQGTDTNTGLFYGTDIVGISTGGSERVRVDASGNVGIGTSSPARALSVQSSSVTVATYKSTAATNLGLISFVDPTTTDDVTVRIGSAGNAMVLQTGGSERMRIDSSGNVLINATAQIAGEKLQVSAGGSTINTAYFNFTTTDDRGNIICKHARATGATTGQQIAFLNSAGTNVGAVNSTTSATSYATSSDYRLKENVQPMVGALDKVAQLKPVTYTWKIDGKDGQGFIAHELQAVVPDCVTGEKDAVDEEGNPKYQGVDTSFLVATLTAAIQEQQTIINDLKARVTALEASNV